MALVMVMTGCWLVYAALASRLRHALQAHGATFPHHQGTPVPHPTARGVLHDCVGMHVLLIPAQWPLVLHRTAAPQPFLKRLGTPDARCYR